MLHHYPLGTRTILVTQACFNLSFYGLKAIFVLYTLHRLQLSKDYAVSLFAAVMALSYGASIGGGWLADRMIGVRLTLVLGGLLSATGALLLELMPNSTLLWALACLSLGSGCVKPAFSTALGLLFKDTHDQRRDQAFRYLYIAMNVGGLLGVLICGFIFGLQATLTQQPCTHQYAFLIIALGLLLGTSLFYARLKHLDGQIYSELGTKLGQVIIILGLSLILIHTLFQHLTHLPAVMTMIMGLGIMIYIVIYQRCQDHERRQLMALIPYILMFTVFCALGEQVGSSLMIFVDQYVDRQIMGLILPTSILPAINPVLVLIISLSMNYKSRPSQQTNLLLSPTKRYAGLIKFGGGFVCLAFSYLLLSGASYLSTTKIGLGWVLAAMVVQTAGEILIVPTGFAMVSKLVPTRYLSTMMSLWIMLIAYGHHLAGFIAQFSLTAPVQSITKDLQHYQDFFLSLSAIALVPGICVLIGVTIVINKKKLKITKSN